MLVLVIRSRGDSLGLNTTGNFFSRDSVFAGVTVNFYLDSQSHMLLLVYICTCISIHEATYPRLFGEVTSVALRKPIDPM